MSSMRSKIGFLANLIPFNEANSFDTSQPDLNLATGGAGDSIQYSTVLQQNQCGSLLVLLKLTSGSVSFKLAFGQPVGSEVGGNLDFDGTPYPLGITATVADTLRHIYKVDLTPTLALAAATPASQYVFEDLVLKNLLYQFRIEENASTPAAYVIDEFFCLETSRLAVGRDYAGSLTAGFLALDKRGADTDWSLDLV